MKPTPQSLLYLSSADVEASCPPMSEAIDMMESMFRQKALGLVELPPKLGLHPTPGSFIHAMPASVSSISATGMKWIAAFPENCGTAYPQISGLIVLNDPRHGQVTAIMDCAIVTAVRTAAASTLSARYLARRDAEVLGILGCGVQGRSHLQAFLCEFGLAKVLAYDVDARILDAFVREMSDSQDIPVIPVASPKEAVVMSDIVLTSGPIADPPRGTIQPGWVRPGAFAVSIDYGSDWSPEALSEFDVLCTDDVSQYASHQGEGYLKGLPPIRLELAHLVSGESPGRTEPSQRTFACNLGIALEDVTLAKAVYEEAVKRNIGTYLHR